MKTHTDYRTLNSDLQEAIRSIKRPAWVVHHYYTTDDPHGRYAWGVGPFLEESADGLFERTKADYGEYIGEFPWFLDSSFARPDHRWIFQRGEKVTQVEVYLGINPPLTYY